MFISLAVILVILAAALSTIYYIKKPDFYPKKYKHVLFIVADDLGNFITSFTNFFLIPKKYLITRLV